MAYQKLQVSRALRVFPSDNADIPFPSATAAGTSTTVVANELQDSSATFVTRNVSVGDVVYNTTTSTAATVTRVIDNTRIILNANIFTVIGNSYIIYAQNQVSNGCVLYIGTGGNLRVLTEAGDDVTFVNVLGGTTLPVQLIRVLSTGTTASNIVAMW